MANKNPIQTAEFLANIKRPQEGDLGVKLSDKAYGVKLPPDVAAVLDNLPQRSAWLRRVISEAAKRELLGQSQGGNVSEKATPPPPPDSPPCVPHPSPKPGAKAKNTRHKK
jgi:hypothetical protein